MNVSELARQLKTNSSELLDILPEYGFDIGKKAIKVDDVIARKIINKWPEIQRDLKIKEQQAEAEKEALQGGQPEEKKTVKIPSVLTVREFAYLIDQPVKEVIKALMKNGLMLSLNEKIDYDTASIVADDFNVNVTLEKSENGQEERANIISEALQNQDKKNLQPRPPVVVVMGHVDHGKTKLLDAIRKSNVIDTEAGGITQHIGAYQVIRKKQPITFIDTPGHEAFTALRSRGAKVANIAILVIAADDGFKPQTLEALKIIQQAQLPMVVAINKIDKPEADIEKVKQELAQNNLIPEDWGGKTVTVPISAKEGVGIDDILDTLILVYEMEKEKIVANPDDLACGTIIESNVDKGEGPVATILVQNGTLQLNDNLTINNAYFGKVRAMKNFKGKPIDAAGPSTPVRVIGFKYAPKVGDIIEVKKEISRKQKKVKPSYDLIETPLSKKIKSGAKKEQAELLNVILKSDVLGSLEVIGESIEKLEIPGVKVNILSQGLGGINESDVLLAESSGALIYGFHVMPTDSAADLAREKQIPIKIYKIIYELLEDIKQEIKNLKPIETEKIYQAELEVLAIFKQEKEGWIIGGKIISGQIEFDKKKPAPFEVVHQEVVVNRGELLQLQCAKEDVTKAVEDQECGLKVALKEQLLEKGDILKFYKEEVIE